MNGDVLLFKTRTNNARVQRLFTGSQYDHVAMILKYDENSQFMIESEGNNGVSCCSWRDMLKYKWYNIYDKLMFRSLKVDKTKNNFFNRLEEFVKQTTGAKYDLGIKKLLGFEKNEYTDDLKNRGYFCSELVAYGYQRLGLLPDKPHSSKYWPGGFSELSMNELQNDAYLDKEKLVNFDL